MMYIYDKEKVRVFGAKLLTKHDYPLLVASCGRCASTMLFDAISRSCLKSILKPAKLWLAPKVRKRKWDLGEGKMSGGMVYTTHDYPDARVRNKKIKCIYTYGNPLEIVASVMKKTEHDGRSWLNLHKRHMNVKENGNLRIIFEKDFLNIQENFIRWYNTGDNVLKIRYDQLWKNEGMISDFLGFKVNLPEKRRRSSSINDLEDKQINKLKETYDIMYRVANNNKYRL